MQTYTSHEFNQHASEAQKAAHTAPVLITLQGKPGLVLISHAEYTRLTGQKKRREHSGSTHPVGRTCRKNGRHRTGNSARQRKRRSAIHGRHQKMSGINARPARL